MSNYVVITSGKSKFVALVLCVLFGMVGAHYFYVGRFGMGVLYLFTAGFFGVGWVVDVFRILLGTFKDDAGYPLRK